MDNNTSVLQVQSSHSGFDGVRDIDWARLAMAIDTDESICRSGDIFVIVIGSTSSKLMDWLIITFGGNVNKGCGGKRATREFYNWHVPSKDKQKVLEGILPYLIIKRKQAEVGLAILPTITHRNYGVPLSDLILRQRYLEVLSELNA